MSGEIQPIPTPIHEGVKAANVQLTPEKYATFGQRFGASLLDGILVTIASGFLSYIWLQAMGDTGKIIGTALSLVVSLLYYVGYQASLGQTLGKRAFGIRVVNVNGATPSFLIFFLREIIGKSIAALILFIGFLMVAWDAKKQGLHDKIAGTYVIKVTC